MNSKNWDTIKKCCNMKNIEKAPVGLIVDSPWIPGYVGISTIDYFTIPEKWFEANLKVINDFPDIIFFPGFWAEFGMATEPSGFGCKISFYEDTTPQVHNILTSLDEFNKLSLPNPKTDGLMPFVLSIYKNMKSRIESVGHMLKIAVSRGPFTIASYVMGLSNFLTELKLNPQSTHKMLKLINDFIKIWLEAQLDVMKDAEGIMLLDDVIGFLSREDYLQFAHPYLKEIFKSYPRYIKIYHNDTDNPVPYEFLEELGVNIFNFTHMRSIAEVRSIIGNSVCLMGNVPPLQVLAQGSVDMVKEHALKCVKDNNGKGGLILSVGGGVSPGTPKENLQALSNYYKY